MRKPLGAQGFEKKGPLKTSKALGFLLCCAHLVNLGKNASGEEVFTRNLATNVSCSSQREHTIFAGSQGRAFMYVLRDWLGGRLQT